MTPGGELCVVGPDIERAVLESEPRQLLEAIVAWPPDYNRGYTVKTAPVGHAWTPTALFMEHALEAAGFEVTSYSGKLRKLPEQGWPLVNLGDWQHGYVCVIP